MEHVIEFGLFFAKVLLIFLALAGLLLLVFGLALRSKIKSDFQVENINEKLDEFEANLESVVLDKDELKGAEKARKEKEKAKAKDETVKPKIYVLEFEGDMEASRVKEFRDEITALLTIARKGDEALICIESPGGTVHGYGLAAAQILRLKAAGVKVTAAVDKVAASGGYMMACTADRILAAPFAIIGSIGVVAMVPNVHRLLKKHDVDYEEMAAGEYKRTISMLGEITEKGRAKFKEQLEDTHVLFKSFVSGNRPQVDISKVATGEYWFGTRALELKLVDQLITSDDYLFQHRETNSIYALKIQPKKKFGEKIQDLVGTAAVRAADHIWQKLRTPPEI